VSYQVNFRLFVPNCEYWESERVLKLQKDLHEACVKVVEESGLKDKQVGLSAGEVTYLSK